MFQTTNQILYARKIFRRGAYFPTEAASTLLCGSPLKLHPPSKLVPGWHSFPKQLKPKPFCMDLEFQTYMELGE